ncbi:putative glycosyl transferase, family 2 [Candidatus Nitrososphaera gargensis Ga9.2]|uniref:Putative glycosyl transferase, family 2 n=2 Tax=Candidatus Nitrososphaera gargensis TaxID=497727 RepID=K0IHY3_NITGG|nr:putative glycosyl transferase, family 2 [Candidatus Nitrososphaera gargensis Ga9.2]
MTIVESLESIMRQSVEPSLVCVVNDGSTDSTSNLLFKLKDSYQNIHIITLEDKGYDSRRIVHNWNIACDYVKKSGKEYDYLLISSDDVVLPKEYVERLIQEMSIDPKLAVVSGNRGLAQSDFISLPEGAGRLIRVSFFSQIGYRHPPYYGYEPWILYKALQMGYRIRKLADLKYEHKRTFGVGHQFIEYGPAMRCLGYHPIFVLARVVRNILTNKTGISKSASLRMLFDYLFEGKWKDDPYFQYFDPELREFIRNLQKQRLFRKLTMI